MPLQTGQLVTPVSTFHIFFSCIDIHEKCIGPMQTGTYSMNEELNEGLMWNKFFDMGDFCK